MSAKSTHSALFWHGLEVQKSKSISQKSPEKPIKQLHAVQSSLGTPPLIHARVQGPVKGPVKQFIHVHNIYRGCIYVTTLAKSSLPVY